jgi:hypothetical protein
VSVDSYIEDEGSAFDLFAPDDEVFAFTTDILRSAGTFLYGRRLYKTMAVWETNGSGRAVRPHGRTHQPQTPR